MRDKLAIALAAIAACLLAFGLYRIFRVVPDDALQGPIYRILYFHVSAGIAGMIGDFVALLFSVMYLSSNQLRWDSLAASIVEVSLVFSVVNLVTGSIWAHIIWGVWWTWGPRLTSQLVCILIFAAYLMLRRGIDEPTQRARLSAALCIFGCVDVVVVWKSIEWFRNLHPSPVLSIRTGGGDIAPAMEEYMIYLILVALLLLGASLVLVRTRQEATAREIDSLRRLAHAAQ